MWSAPELQHGAAKDFTLTVPPFPRPRGSAARGEYGDDSGNWVKGEYHDDVGNKKQVEGEYRDDFGSSAKGEYRSGADDLRSVVASTKVSSCVGGEKRA